MASNRSALISHIIRFCETPKDKSRIMTRLSLNSVEAEAYLNILMKQSMIAQNNGKYEMTPTGHDYLFNCDRLRRIQAR